MHRPTVAALALVLVIAGGILLATAGDVGSRQNLGGSCLRVGMVLGLLWLALPDVARPASRSVVFGVILAVLLLARFPKLIVVLLGFLVVFALLRPRLLLYLRER